MPSSSLRPSSSTKQATHHSLIDMVMGDEKPSSLLHWSPTKHTPHNPTDMAIGGEKTETEIKLERDGNTNALQRYRYLTWHEDPFDMIDAPPSYDQIEKKGVKGLLDWVQAKV
ncbi:hypothetical protein N7519_000710 [Penicillium mononematosum]|uniref:uncharacterized protein n=1 Tax=Penicillium mononematosum TaxID=268346 RepID=UPI002547F938|nr:uncharacterized protein N7519_000710 [Penicillium mononematosum]KAJ6190689.1 hypothetical protein N7519_000710 [Penicillium mononematosum]